MLLYNYQSFSPPPFKLAPNSTFITFSLFISVQATGNDPVLLHRALVYLLLYSIISRNQYYFT